MLKMISRLFGIEDLSDRKDIDNLKTEIYNIRQELIALSNIVGKLAGRVDKLTRAVNNHAIEIDKMVKTQLEMEYENASIIEGLRAVSGPKNRLIAFPSVKDDDDDLIN